MNPNSDCVVCEGSGRVSVCSGLSDESCRNCNGTGIRSLGPAEEGKTDKPREFLVIDNMEKPGFSARPLDEKEREFIKTYGVTRSCNTIHVREVIAGQPTVEELTAEIEMLKKDENLDVSVKHVETITMLKDRERKLLECIKDCASSMQGQILGCFHMVKQLDGSIRREYVKTHLGETFDRKKALLKELGEE